MPETSTRQPPTASAAPARFDRLTALGAGSIGIELEVAMDLFSYDLAATIILADFVLVVLVEQIGSHLQRII